ncbi:zinc finger CCHC domain-containing 12-like protein [Labeo rohita]|uniref:Zinc finger CCHC domain-containing 12-like protein n=1 Tax=Labeo rohita TaxID=84645 RepID=A0A498NXW5_LABRO|nr:zinc finger CCHC domain-containing 12-like protein [Labeo rohita]
MYLEILDSAFGTVEDGDDSFAKYLNTVQDNGEKPSAYLQRLQVMLNTAFRRELEQKKQNPPTFAELLLLLRTAEDKRTSKASRMKQYFSASKQKVSSHYQGVYFQYEEECIPSQSTSHPR